MCIRDRLRGARGNSGVITSLLFRGFSKALEGKKEADASDIVEMCIRDRQGLVHALLSHDVLHHLVEEGIGEVSCLLYTSRCV